MHLKEQEQKLYLKKKRELERYGSNSFCLIVIRFDVCYVNVYI